jgi:hypothetical protein
MRSRPVSLLHLASAALLLCTAPAFGSPLNITSATRVITLAASGSDDFGPVPSVGLGTTFDGVGAFSETLSGTTSSSFYGTTFVFEASQNSDVSETNIIFSGLTSVGVEPVSSLGVSLTVSGSSTMTVEFTAAIDQPYEFSWASEDQCLSGFNHVGCTSFELENLTIGTMIFWKDGATVYYENGQFTDDAVAGSTSGLLTAADYRLTAGTSMHWGSRIDRQYAGAPLDLAFTVPEPSTAALLALGLVGIAALRRRRAN